MFSECLKPYPYSHWRQRHYQVSHWCPTFFATSSRVFKKTLQLAFTASKDLFHSHFGIKPFPGSHRYLRPFPKSHWGLRSSPGIHWYLKLSTGTHWGLSPFHVPSVSQLCSGFHRSLRYYPGSHWGLKVFSISHYFIKPSTCFHYVWKPSPDSHWWLKAFLKVLTSIQGLYQNFIEALGFPPGIYCNLGNLLKVLSGAQHLLRI